MRLRADQVEGISDRVEVIVENTKQATLTARRLANIEAWIMALQAAPGVGATLPPFKPGT